MKLSFLYFVLILVFFSCENKNNKLKNTSHIRQNKHRMNDGFSLIYEKQPKKYIDYLLNNLDSKGSFISLKVTNKNKIKRLIIENGRFYSLYSNNEEFNKKEYIRKVKPFVVSGEILKLSDTQWTQCLDNMLDTNDYFTDDEYEKNVNAHFHNNNQINEIESKTLLKLAYYAFSNNFLINKHCYSGFYEISPRVFKE